MDSDLASEPVQLEKTFFIFRKALRKSVHGKSKIFFSSLATFFCGTAQKRCSDKIIFYTERSAAISSLTSKKIFRKEKFSIEVFFFGAKI